MRSAGTVAADRNSTLPHNGPLIRGRRGTHVNDDAPLHRERFLLGAYAAGLLDPDEAELVARHLAGCLSCQVEHEKVLATSDLLRWYVDRGGDI